MYVLEFEDDNGNYYQEQYDWTWLEGQAAIKELRKQGFCNIELIYVGE